jgi:hypothetical protein
MGVDLAFLTWRTVSASVAGRLHAEAGQACADACAVRVLRAGKGSLLVAVAADGAGTAERGGEGARLACEATLARAEAWANGGGAAVAPPTVSSFGREDALSWVRVARERIAESAQAQGRESREFSCTLLVALVDEESAVFFQVGDGAIVYRGPGGVYVPALWPQSGEYANCTFFVTDDEVAEHLQSAWAEGVHEVALLTDGLQGLALRFGSREAHAPFFEPMFARLRREPQGTPEGLLEELRAFLDSSAVNQRTDDDKTLVLATRLACKPPGPADEEG